MIEVLIPVLFSLVLDAQNGPELPLSFGSHDEVWPHDSIPSKADERIVLWTTHLPANWVVVLVDSPYEQFQGSIRELVQDALGIESEQEITMPVAEGEPVNPHKPKDPLLGDGFRDFHSIGVPVTEVREYRIYSKNYNTFRWTGYSKSEWRIIDGSRLFDKACTLLVISRTDHSREWAWMHPGIPLPFFVTGDTKLVTDREINLLNRLFETNRSLSISFFVPYPGYNTNSVVDLMETIYKAVRTLNRTGANTNDS